MKKQIATLFEYEKWANERILNSIAQLKGPDEKCLDLVSHILLVQMVWYSRMEGKASPPRMGKKSLNECREIYTVNNKILASFLAQQTDETLKKAIKYKTSKGMNSAIRFQKF